MNQWIDASTLLPPMETPVLAVAQGYPNPYLCAALRREDEEGWMWAVSNGVLNSPNDFDDENDYAITHWMTLPELPQRSQA